MSSESFPLVCLPFAGSGAGFYRAWAEASTHGITVLAIQLPGREELFLETLFTDASDAAAALTPQIVDLTADLPHFALFGANLTGSAISHLFERFGAVERPWRDRAQ
jgi:surfactin synthase thioesterase subunit